MVTESIKLEPRSRKEIFAAVGVKENKLKSLSSQLNHKLSRALLSIKELKDMQSIRLRSLGAKGMRAVRRKVSRGKREYSRI